MRRPALTAALLLAAVVPAAAGTDLPTPVCAQSEVLQLVREQLQHAGQPGVLEADSVGQVASGRDNLVYCAVRIHTVAYDTPRAGPLPIDVVSVYQYALELRRNGVFLLPRR